MNPKHDEAREREEMEGVSIDVALELQSKVFEQLAAVGLGGAGLVITLAGSILPASPVVWISAVEFGLAAMVALTAQHHLIDAIFRRAPQRRRSRLMTVVAILLIGMGVGSLGTSVFLLAKPKPAATAT
jgi:hypothetical protein